MISVSRILYPRSRLPFFPSLPLSYSIHVVVAHDITADRSLFDQLAMLFLLKVGASDTGSRGPRERSYSD